MRVAVAATALASAFSLDNGLARTPPLGWNSWNFLGTSVNSRALRETADFLVSSNLATAGYKVVSTDDGWMSGRDSQGRMLPNAVNFPDGMAALATYMKARGLELGLYSAASSVVCSGRVGSLYNEAIDAQTFASWGVGYVKCSSLLIFSGSARTLEELLCPYLNCIPSPTAPCR